MKYLYLLTVTDEETGDPVCHIEAKSQESLQEQLGKVDTAITEYESSKNLSDCCGAPVTEGGFCMSCGEHDRT